MLDRPSSAVVLDRIRLAHGKDIDLTLRNSYATLLERLGSPQEHLPPTIVVAGTNGKGSTCAFLRAMIEAEGKTAHVYTSPHLVTHHERIRIAGRLIGEDELSQILLEIEAKADPGSISFFEAGTAAALTAFARNKADITILEVGLGGRLDATNVVPHPIGAIISRLSYDHRDYLGDTMAAIAHEKAGIMRKGIPCFIAAQPSNEALQTLRRESSEKGATLIEGNKDWSIQENADGTFNFISATRRVMNLPRPALVGAHQFRNAGLAIAATACLPFSISDEAIRKAMTNVDWPGRLQKITHGTLAERMPAGCELWLDGGHNDSAGEALAAQAQAWRAQDDKPLDVIYAMLVSKKPAEFLTPLKPFIRRLRTVTIQGDVPGFDAQTLAQEACAVGLTDVRPATSLRAACDDLLSGDTTPRRILVCGSMVLVGLALRESSAP